MKTIVGITGTTSVGKSAVAVHLAQLMHTEVISADSMQIYKGMDIGTAKITTVEMRGIKHHMLDIVEPNVNFSSFLYQEQASKIIDNNNFTPIVVGGTGFYFDSLLYPPEFGECDAQRKKELRNLLEKEGLQYLQEMLLSIDSESYNSIDICNPKRVLRAIEIAESGVKKSQGNKRNIEPRYNCKLFILQRDRNSLYAQMDSRVDKMIEQGLVCEVEDLVAKYGICNTSAFSAIGYKEIIEYLQGRISFEDAVEKIKLNTRHYAKRQMTYFKRMNVMKYIDVDNRGTADIAYQIFNCIKNA